MYDLTAFRRKYKLTQKQVADLFNCNQSNISGMEKTQRDLEPYQRDILVREYGENAVNEYFLPSDTSDKPVGQKAAYPSDASDLSDIDFRLVPILHIDSVGGMHSDNAIVAEPQYVEGYAPFTDAKDGDICIIQSGDSMVPTCPSGSLLLLRQVTNWQDYFGYGNIFVLELTDGRRITKEVTRYDANPQEYVWCVSHNPNVPDEELPKKMIASVWKVIKIQIDKGW